MRDAEKGIGPEGRNSVVGDIIRMYGRDDDKF
jgi:hypothetical protein